MKSLRMFGLPLAALAATLVLAGCGDSQAPTAAGPSFDTTPPPAPAHLTLSHDATARPALTWQPSAAADVIGYKVYVYSPSPERDNAYMLIGDSMVTESMFSFADSVNAAGIYRVRAVDAAGNVSAFSAAFTVILHGNREPITHE